MNEWCIKTHGETGLTQRVRDSKVNLKQAEQQILDFIKKYVPSQSSPLCGNSIWQDRRFLANICLKLMIIVTIVFWMLQVLSC